MTGAKIRITELEKEKEVAVLRTTSEMSKKAIKISKEKMKIIDAKIQKIEAEKDAIRISVGRMNPSKLKAGFKKEGF